ncbi:hypothetical protein ACH415_33055 [Streptomyces californicus]
MADGLITNAPFTADEMVFVTQWLKGRALSPGGALVLNPALVPHYL